MVSRTELSEDFLIIIFPDSASTASLKVNTMFASVATPVSSSAGVELTRIGSFCVDKIVIVVSASTVAVSPFKPPYSIR